MVKIIFKSLLALFLRFGLFFSRPFVGKEIVVLNYHSVSADGWIYSVNPEIFEKQMKYLAENCHVVDLSEIIDYIKGKKDLPTRTVALTFDDGYADFLANALPILKKYNLPATLFMIGSLNGGVDLGGGSTLSAGNLKTIVESGINIGSHGLTHRSLDKLAIGEMEYELVESKRKLEEIVSKKIRYMAYPKGKFSETVINAAQTIGYEAAFSIKQGLIKKGCNLLSIKRVVVDRNQNMLIFKTRLTKAVDWWTKFWQIYH